MLAGLFTSRGGEATYRALSMGSAILWDGMLSKKVAWRGDLGNGSQRCCCERVLL